MKKRVFLIVISFIVVSLLIGCNTTYIPTTPSSAPETKMSEESEPENTEEIRVSDLPLDNENEIEWQIDSTSTFYYIKYKNTDDGKPFFLRGGQFPDMMEYEFPCNRFIYEKDVNGIKMYGYMDENFNIKSQPIFTEPYVFQLGLARALTKTGSFIIDSAMRKVEEYYPGFVVYEDAVIVVDWTYKPVTEPFVVNNVDYENYLVPVRIYDDTKTSEGSGSYKVGYAPVGKVTSGLVTKEECTVPPIYEEARLFHDGLAAVLRFGYWGFIDENGDTVIECIYDEANDFYSGVTAVLLKDLKGNGSMIRKWSIINKEDESLSGFIYEEITDYHDGFALAIYDFKPGKNLIILNVKGQSISDRRLTDYRSSTQMGYDYRFHEGYMIVASAGECFIDVNGESPFLIQPGDLRNFSDGLAAVNEYRSPYWGYINTDGEFVTDYKYEYAQDFDEGYTLVREELYSPGYIINKEEEKFLEELNLFKLTRFNEDGYALAYGLPEGVDKIKFTVNEYGEIEVGEETIYYMIKINGDN